MNKEDNKNNEVTENNESEEKKEISYDLTLDILVGIQSILQIAFSRGVYTQEELPYSVGIFNYYNKSLEKLLKQFQENHPELVQNLIKQAEEKEKEILENNPELVGKLEEMKKVLNEEDKVNNLPDNIKNGCDDKDIQG